MFYLYTCFYKTLEVKIETFIYFICLVSTKLYLKYKSIKLFEFRGRRVASLRFSDVWRVDESCHIKE